MEQLSVTLRRTEDGWQLAAAVGVAGMDHARDVNRSRRPVSEDEAGAIALVVGRAMGDLDMAAFTFDAP